MTDNPTVHPKTVYVVRSAKTVWLTVAKHNAEAEQNVRAKYSDVPDELESIGPIQNAFDEFAEHNTVLLTALTDDAEHDPTIFS